MTDICHLTVASGIDRNTRFRCIMCLFVWREHYYSRGLLSRRSGSIWWGVKVSISCEMDKVSVFHSVVCVLVKRWSLFKSVWWLLSLGACEGYGGRFDKSIPACGFCFFVLVEISSRAPVPLFYANDQTTVAQRAETIVDERPLANCVWARFPDGFLLYARTDFIWSRACECLPVTCHPALFAEWLRSFTCYRGNGGVEPVLR